MYKIHIFRTEIKNIFKRETCVFISQEQEIITIVLHLLIYLDLSHNN